MGQVNSSTFVIMNMDTHWYFNGFDGSGYPSWTSDPQMAKRYATDEASVSGDLTTLRQTHHIRATTTSEQMRWE